MPPDPGSGSIVVICRNSRPQPTCNVTQRWTGHVLLLEALTLICGSSFWVPRVSRLQRQAGGLDLTGGALRQEIVPRRQEFPIQYHRLPSVRQHEPLYAQAVCSCFDLLADIPSPSFDDHLFLICTHPRRTSIHASMMGKSGT